MPSINDYFIPTEKQREAFKYVGKGGRIFYGGARGGGKSAFALYAAVSACLQFPKLKCVAIRETYGELEEAFISPLQTKYPEEPFGYIYKDKTKTATFKNGSKLIFKACDSPKAAKKIQGIEYQFMIIDEAPNFDVMTIHKLTGSLRSALANTFIPTVLQTGNPGGISDVYFQTRFVNPIYKEWESYELKHKAKYIFIPANVYDNPHVTADYRETLEGLPEHLRLAWLEGRWGIFEGQFFEEWNPDIHVVEPFDIPSNWVRKSGMDLGWSTKHPTVCVWTAQNPETLEVYVYREYTCTGNTEQYADEINMLEAEDGYVEAYADPAMFYKQKPQDGFAESDSDIFLRKGRYLQPAINDRVQGWRVLKQWIHHNNRRGPKLRVFNECRLLIQTMPILRYDINTRIKKNDMDTKMQDDAADALRYVMVSGYQYPTTEDQIEQGTYVQTERRREEREKRYSDWGMQAPYNDFLGLNTFSDKALY